MWLWLGVQSDTPTALSSVAVVGQWCPILFLWRSSFRGTRQRKPGPGAEGPRAPTEGQKSIPLRRRTGGLETANDCGVRGRQETDPSNRTLGKPIGLRVAPIASHSIQSCSVPSPRIQGYRRTPQSKDTKTRRQRLDPQGPGTATQTELAGSLP